ncbi:MAG: Lrp/AsnC family transcriptional regulator [Alphaproteobacteria bacterium]|jgi:DNA-binding Lrp family transcriptional regulator
MAKLDRINRRILSDLQADGRITNVELAANAGISPPPCLRRLRALEDEGYIRGYHADVEPTMLGYEAELFALVGLESQALDRLQGFEATVDGWNEVRECHMVQGGGDFLLRIVARDTAHVSAITQRISGTKDVIRVTTFPVIRTAKREPGVPIDARNEI